MLEVKNLKTVFEVGSKTVTAVDNVSFKVEKGKVIGLVGESGSGKSVTSLSILNLLPDTGRIVSGEVIYQNQNLLSLTAKQIRKIRGGEIGLIFQNPQAALNPVFTVGNQMIETIMLHRNMTKEEALQEAISLLQKVNIPDAEARLHDYPHQFSLGMCQRVMIALTLAMRPNLLIADEPTASLDVTIQAQILALLKDLREEFNMSILLISHDLGVIAQHCDEILVMYLGRIVESGNPLEIFKNPKHPYTQALIASIPIPDPSMKQVPTLLKGDVPSPLRIPKGCRFHTRCPKVMPQCSEVDPQLKAVDDVQVACLLYT